MILNNSNKKQVNTQLAGYIYGNKNLINSNSAKIILNEVTSKNKTYLKGFTEIAGNRANVVVANPNGIYINGAGFINTYKATITTGKPNIVNGNIANYEVRKGEINVLEKGLNTVNVNKAELFANVVSVNAKIYANDLDVVTGKNNISLNANVKSLERKDENNKINFSLDSSSLGGIYANKINLIGTAKGVGVNLPIELNAKDNLSLSFDGKIVLDKIISQKDVHVQSNSNSIKSNVIYAKAVNLKAKKSVLNEEIIVGSNSVNLKANEIINKNAIASLNKDINIEALNLVNYNTIYSNDNLNLYVKNKLLNVTNNDVVNLSNEKATIFAKNSINIQGNKEKTQRTNEVVNDKAIIQSSNEDVNIFANALDNLSSPVKIKGEFVNNGSSKVIKDGIRINSKTISRDQDGYTYNSFHMYTDTMSYEPYVSSEILVGNNLNLDVKNLNNNYSLIFANNNMLLNVQSIVNNSKDIVQLKTTHKDIYVENTYKKKWYRGWGTVHESRYEGTQTFYDVNVIDQISSTIQARNTISANIDLLQNGIVENKALQSKTYNPVNNSLLNEAMQINTNSSLNSPAKEYKLPSNKYSRFVVANPNKNLPYLIESNPLYTDLSNFVGSSYFLEKLDYRFDRVSKKLGDASYETKLVNDQIYAKTNKRYLNPKFKNENEQFIALMDSGVKLGKDLNLEIGKALSKEQIEELSDDIVWMEEKEINDQIVLVPVVYLANTNKKQKGAIIQANNIALNVKEDFYNSGSIKANNNLSLNANSIINNSGNIISDNQIALTSNNNLVNKNGSLIKANDIQITSNANVVNQTYVDTNNSSKDNGNFTYTNLGKQSSIEASNNLIIQASKDITNIGANLYASNNVLLQSSNGDVNLNAIKLENSYDISFWGGFDKEKYIDYQTSNLKANNILINSSNDINLEASKLIAKDQINLNSKNDVNVLALNKEYYKDTQITSKGFLSKTVQRDMQYKEDVSSSSINAKDIIINANNSVSLEASKLKAKDNIIVNAKDGDINVLAKEYRQGQLHLKDKSSLVGLKKSLDIKSSNTIKLNSALLETQASNVLLSSRNDINILASEISSAGDIQLKALNDVLIASQNQYLQSKEIQEKSSFNIQGLTGLVGSNKSIYSKELHKNDKLNSISVQSSLNANKDILINSGSTSIIGSDLEANNIDIKAHTGKIDVLSSTNTQTSTSLDKKIDFKLANAKDMVNSLKNTFKGGNTKLKLELGSLSSDSVDKTTQNVSNNSSNLKAKENLSLDSLNDINITGSNLSANDNLVLNSNVGDINILNSIDTSNVDVKEQHLKAKVSISVQNEYVEIAKAVEDVKKSQKQLKQTKDDYSTYKKELRKLDNTLKDLEKRYKNKEAGIEYSDIEDLKEFIGELKSQDKYYKAAITAASANLASKIVAIPSQASKAASTPYGFNIGMSLDVQGSKTQTANSSKISNASNINANNIFINTNDKFSQRVQSTRNTNTNITGSNIVANEDIFVNTNNLNVKASQDIYNSSSNTKSLNANASVTLQGKEGLNFNSLNAGFGKDKSSSNSLINNNSQVIANNMYLNVNNDANFLGANVKANDSLKLDVGNNLDLQSLKDEYSSNSKGSNVSLGGGSGSFNAGVSNSNAITTNKQTVLSSIIASKVDVNVKNNTHLKSSLLASGEYDNNKNFIDNKTLNFNTNTLNFENSSNNSYSSNRSLGLKVE